LGYQCAELGSQIGWCKERVVAKQLGMFSVERIEFIKTVRRDITNTGQSTFRELQMIWIDITGLRAFFAQRHGLAVFTNPVKVIFSSISDFRKLSK